MTNKVHLTKEEAKESLKILLKNNRGILSCGDADCGGQSCATCILNNNNNSSNIQYVDIDMLTYALNSSFVDE